MSLGQSQNFFQTFEQSLSLHFLGVDSFIDSLPAASTCARKQRPNEQLLATSPLVAELVDLSDEFSNVCHPCSVLLFRDSDNITTARCTSILSKLAVRITTKLNKNPIAISRPRLGPGVRSCRKRPVMLLVLLLVRIACSGTSMNMWFVQQVAVGILCRTFVLVTRKCTLAAINVIDESKRFVPLGFVSKRLCEDVGHLFICTNIDHVKQSTLKLLLQSSKRNALSAIGMSHLLTVSFGNDGDRGLIVLKKLNLEHFRKVNIQPIDVGN